MYIQAPIHLNNFYLGYWPLNLHFRGNLILFYKLKTLIVKIANLFNLKNVFYAYQKRRHCWRHCYILDAFVQLYNLTCHIKFNLKLNRAHEKFTKMFTKF